MSEPTKPFTGRSRQRKTHKGVMLADAFARVLISAGGIATIIAVLGVCLFLVWVVLPLFTGADIEHPEAVTMATPGGTIQYLTADEYQVMGLTISGDGVLRTFRLDDGQTLYEQPLFAERELTASSFGIHQSNMAFGFADGSVQLADISFVTNFPNEVTLPQDVVARLKDSVVGTAVNYEDGIVQLTVDGQYRTRQLKVTLGKSRKIADGPIRRIAHVSRSGGQLVCMLSGAGETYRLQAVVAKEKENFFTGEKTIALGKAIDLPFENYGQSEPSFLALSGPGSDVFVAWKNGSLLRVRCNNLKQAFVAERGRLIDGDATLTSMRFVLGNNTLVWGDSKGGVYGGFAVRKDEFVGPGLRDAWREPLKSSYAFAITKQYQQQGPMLKVIAPSGRSRLMLCGFDDGQVKLFNVTSQSRLVTLQMPGEGAIDHLTITPKEDGLVAVSGGQFAHCAMDPRHPEASFSSLFTMVWYEGYGQPQHMWQSSSGTDDSEAKLGLMPLVIGTLKATFYSMLFGAPIALMAAVYSSEFLNPKVKAAVKPTIEMMASLPSVVLGFIAALVLAPMVEQVVAPTLLLLMTVPFALLLAANLWQLLPQQLTIRLAQWRLLFGVVPVVGGVLLAAWVGPWIEQIFFAGDIKGWSAWAPGIAEPSKEGYRSGVGGWLLLLLPLSAVLVALAVGRWANPVISRLDWSRRRLAWLNLGKFVLASGATVVLALIVAGLLDTMRFDPRSSFLIWGVDLSLMGTYVQRNSLIVGFIMGFAIIPIIYTIADDALSSVPNHLRSASLGAGATPWQTAVRVVIPTAMSGLFSALMIGLGRAVGETMIVLMATGNTPILELNLFNGFRTLSANIAVELPEAVRDSTHYRTLFLAALVLFAMTFVVNTIAEVVRLRFRKRAYQL